MIKYVQNIQPITGKMGSIHLFGRRSRTWNSAGVLRSLPRHPFPRHRAPHWLRCFVLFCFFHFLFYFTIPYLFCHTLTWIHHGCTCDSKHEPPSHLPPHNIPLGHPRAPSPSMLYPASDIDWWFDSYMIVYMFQCHSPKSSHPLPLPLSPKVCYTAIVLCVAQSK